VKEKTLPVMMTRPERLSQLRKTDVRRAGEGVGEFVSISHYLLVAGQLHDLLFIAGIIGCDARRCLSDFAKRCAFVGVV
jgi:hypothetical protein